MMLNNDMVEKGDYGHKKNCIFFKIKFWNDYENGLLDLPRGVNFK